MKDLIGWSRDEIVAELVKRGTAKDRAVQYADCFLEYQEASENLVKNGTIVQHPRTANPITNPYLAIRDGALRKLQGFRGIKAEFLW
jgi:Phage terminase, small subunit